MLRLSWLRLTCSRCCVSCRCSPALPARPLPASGARRSRGPVARHWGLGRNLEPRAQTVPASCVGSRLSRCSVCVCPEVCAAPHAFRQRDAGSIAAAAAARATATATADVYVGLRRRARRAARRDPVRGAGGDAGVPRWRRGHGNRHAAGGHHHRRLPQPPWRAFGRQRTRLGQQPAPQPQPVLRRRLQPVARRRAQGSGGGERRRNGG
mmetsp:Transcript_16251/g.46807  ORF Transcript_16251/g.46807 Transcript_16251/m.46807 type:complete len:209 (+) Transcript_16251:745-1371(+)